MKNFMKLSVILLAVVFMACSCDPTDDPIVPEPTGAITLSELEGVWSSTQYEYDGDSYFDCDDLENQFSAHDDVLAGDLMLITVDMTTSDWTLDSKCTSIGTKGDGYSYDRDNGKLVLSASGLYSYKFDVVSYDRINKTLVLKIIAENIGGIYPPINGVYTLQKQQ